MAPPSVAPPVVAPSVPTIPTAQGAAPSTTPTPTVDPRPAATASSSVPMVQPTTGGVSFTTNAGPQLPRARPPTTEECPSKRVATEAAALLRGPQLAAGGGQRAQPPIHFCRKGCRLTSGGRKPRQRSSGCGPWASNSKRKPKKKPSTRASGRLPKWRRTLLKRPRRRRGKPGKSGWRPWAPSQ
jgi:hypothetical protein